MEKYLWIPMRDSEIDKFQITIYDNSVNLSKIAF